MRGLGVDQQVSVDVARVDQMRAGQQVLGPERRVHRRAHGHVRHRRPRRLDVDNEVRAVRITGLGEVGLVEVPRSFVP